MLDLASPNLYQQSVADTAHLPCLPSAVYGQESILVSPLNSRVGIGLIRQNRAVFDFHFGLSLLLLLFLVIFAVAFRKSSVKLLTSCFSFKKFLAFQHERSGFGILFFLFLCLFSLFSISFLFSEFLQQLPVFADWSFELLFLLLMLAAFALLLVRKATCLFIGLISNEKQLFADVASTQVIFGGVINLIISSFFLVKMFLDISLGSVLIMPLCILLLLMLCLYFFRTIRLFMQEKISLFFWILYFCTIEILPLVIVFKFFEEA